MKKDKLTYLLILLVLLLFLFRDFLNMIMINKDELLQASIINTALVTELKTDNEALKNIIAGADALNYEATISKVKYRNIYDFKQEMTIFKGKEQGLKAGDAVLNTEGLIGMIKKVNKNTAIVRLLTNKESNASVKINDAFGILKMKDGEMVVSNMTNYDKVQVGDKIYTSGLGNLPGSILIGEVAAITNDSLEIEKIITVKWAVDFTHLNYVYVVGGK